MPTLSTAVFPSLSDWNEFEAICADIYSREWSDPNVVRNGRQGQRQQGVDIYGQRHGRGRYLGLQCKLHGSANDLQLSEIESELQKAEAFEPPLGDFTIATTARRDAKLQTQVRRLSKGRVAANRFSVRVHFWEDIQSRLARHEGLARLHYPQFFGDTGRGTPASMCESRRLCRLDELERFAQARAANGWIAASVPEAEAWALVGDPTVGAPPAELLQPQNRLILLIGDIGAGKSLIASRLLLSAIAAARTDARAPTPVFLEAPNVVTKLKEAIDEACSHLGNQEDQGAFVVVDRGDEAGGVGLVSDLLAQAHGIVAAQRNTTIIILTRQLSLHQHSAKEITLRRLTDGEAYALVSRFAHLPITEHMRWTWPPSLEDAIHRPLFAVLLGMHLRNEGQQSPKSVGELVSSLVHRALKRTGADENAMQQLMAALGRLAAECIDRSGPVAAAEIAETRPDQEVLKSSRLVVEQPAGLAFPLPLLTEWFAAQQLAEGTIPVSELIDDPERLERWRYPLVTFASTFGHPIVSKMLTPLAERDPGFAAQIVAEGLKRRWLGPAAALPPARECGHRLSDTLLAWAQGLGPLATLLDPIQEDGSLPPLGVSAVKNHLVAWWYRADAELPAVFLLDFEVAKSEPALSAAWLRESMRAGDQPAWIWRWTLDRLASRLAEVLRRRTLRLNSGPFLREAVWRMALAITGRGSLHHSPVPLAEIERQLDRLSPNISTLGVQGVELSRADLNQLRADIARRRQTGEAELCAPWPGPDQNRADTPWVWGLFSAEQLLSRTSAIYAAALEGYQQLLSAWSPRLAPRLATIAALPARLTGVLVPAKPGGRWENGPYLSWYLEPLPAGAVTSVDIRLGREPLGVDHLQRAYELLHTHRGRSARRIRLTLRRETPAVFDPDPVTRLVYQWLQDDLQQTGFVR